MISSQAIATAAGRRPDARLLAMINDTVVHDHVARLATFLTKGDVLVLNDAMTLPAGFFGRHEPTGRPIEMRLVENLGAAAIDPARWRVVFFGDKDHRTDTRERPSPPRLQAGDRIALHSGLTAVIQAVSRESPRLASIRFTGDHRSLWRKIYLAGHAIQYSYLEKPIALWDVQTAFAAVPMALEAPSASFPLTWELMLSLKQRGIELVTVSHATGVSATGDDELDRRLPFPEHFAVSERAATVINRQRARGGLVIAVGTGVMRALESSATQGGEVVARRGKTTLKIDRHHRRLVTDGILTGMHESGSSHLDLLASFVPAEALAEAYRAAAGDGYLWHEFGDLNLILPLPFHSDTMAGLGSSQSAFAERRVDKLGR